MTISSAKLATLNFFELYGLARTLGKTPRQTLDILARPPDEAVVQLLTLAGAQGAIAQATVKGNIDMVVAFAQGVASAIGGGAVGQLVGAVASAFGQLVKWAAEAATVTCSTGCGNEDADRRGFVGLWPPPAFSGAIGMTAAPLVGYWHDGLIKIGVTQEEPLGPEKGAYCRIQDGAPDPKNRSERLWRSSGITSVPKGTWERPWEQTAEKYYRRAWMMNSTLQWVQDNVPCSHILCMAAQLGGLPRVMVAAANNPAHGSTAYGKALSSADAECRRKGGRWAASVYWMQKDLAAGIHQMGRTLSAQMLRELGDTATATELEKWLPQDGMTTTQLGAHWRATYQPQQLEYNWTPIMRHLSYDNARALLGRLYPPTVRTIAFTPTLQKGLNLSRSAPVDDGVTPGAVGATSAAIRYGVPIAAVVAALGLVWYFTRGK